MSCEDYDADEERAAVMRDKWVIGRIEFAPGQYFPKRADIVRRYVQDATSAISGKSLGHDVDADPALRELILSIRRLILDEPGDVMADILRLAKVNVEADLTFAQIDAAQRLVDRLVGQGT